MRKVPLSRKSESAKSDAFSVDFLSVTLTVCRLPVVPVLVEFFADVVDFTEVTGCGCYQGNAGQEGDNGELHFDKLAGLEKYERRSSGTVSTTEFHSLYTQN
jgi:hypothetical protein